MENLYFNYKIYKYKCLDIINSNYLNQNKTYAANKVVKGLFNISNRLQEELSEAFNKKYQAKRVYYSNLAYYKNFGGLFPTTKYIDDLEEYIGWLKTTKKEIYNLINNIKAKTPWQYDERSIKIISLFKEMIAR